jgi:thioredoxin reductase
VLVVDSGSPRNAPASEMHMYLTRDGFPPRDFLALGRKDLAAYPGIEVRDGLVVAARGSAGDFALELADGEVVRGRRLVLATGQTDEPLDIPGLADRFGKGVFHCPFCHGWESGDKTIAVVTRDPADAMLALYLNDRFSSDVVLCTHGELEFPEPIATAVAKRDLPSWRLPCGRSPAPQAT